MIVPLTVETEWICALRAVQAWHPLRSKTLVIAPHPDDETLGAGGFIAARTSTGSEVLVVAVTDGENAYPDSIGLGEIRRKEQEKALARLGVGVGSIIRLGLPDSDVATQESKLVELLLPLVSQETHIVAPWPGDFHPDHEACGRAAHEAAGRIGASLTFYFFWTWHRGTPAILQNLPLRSFALSSEQQRAKWDALLHHHSQLVHFSGDPILPDSLLGPARRSFEVFLPA